MHTICVVIIWLQNRYLYHVVSDRGHRHCKLFKSVTQVGPNMSLVIFLMKQFFFQHAKEDENWDGLLSSDLWLQLRRKIDASSEIFLSTLHWLLCIDFHDSTTAFARNSLPFFAYCSVKMPHLENNNNRFSSILVSLIASRKLIVFIHPYIQMPWHDSKKISLWILNEHDNQAFRKGCLT